LFEAASMLGCTPAQFFRGAAGRVAVDLHRAAAGAGPGFVIVVEMTGVPQGLGAVIMDGRTLCRTELVICGMLVMGIAGFISDRVVVMIMHRLLRWSPSHHG
jgi:NitT/TauT family transport system permease protein